jgi:hypothetical protein
MGRKDRKPIFCKEHHIYCLMGELLLLWVLNKLAPINLLWEQKLVLKGMKDKKNAKMVTEVLTNYTTIESGQSRI